MGVLPGTNTDQTELASGISVEANLLQAG